MWHSAVVRESFVGAMRRSGGVGIAAAAAAHTVRRMALQGTLPRSSSSSSSSSWRVRRIVVPRSHQYRHHHPSPLVGWYHCWAADHPVRERSFAPTMARNVVSASVLLNAAPFTTTPTAAAAAAAAATSPGTDTGICHGVPSETTTERMVRITSAVSAAASPTDESDWSVDEHALILAWRHGRDAQIAHSVTANVASTAAAAGGAATATTTTHASARVVVQALSRLVQMLHDRQWWDAALETEETLATYISQAVGGGGGVEDPVQDQPTTTTTTGHTEYTTTTGTTLSRLHHWQGDSYYHQGRCHVFLQRPDRARRLYEQALACYQQACHPTTTTNNAPPTTTSSTPLQDSDSTTRMVVVGMGDIYVALAGLDYQAHQLDAALLQLQRAESFYTPPDTCGGGSNVGANSSDDGVHGLVRCLQQQGFIYRQQENYTMALQVYQRAAAAAATVAWMLPDVDNDGRSTVAQHHNDDTHTMLEKVVPYRIPKRTPRHELISELTLDQADMHSALDEYDAALSLYQSLLPNGATETFSTPPTTTHAVVWHSMGKIHARLGRHDQAVSCLLRSLDLKRRLLPSNMTTYHPELAKTLHALGTVYAAMGDHPGEAVACFKEVLIVTRAGVAPGESPDRDPFVLQAMQNLKLVLDDINNNS